MKVAVFSTKPYDQEYFEKYKQIHSHEFVFFDTALNENTANLTTGFEAVCVFVNDKVNKTTISKLAANGIRLIALRCAGYNNVDIAACKEKKIKVLRVPAYSPEAVAEHALALILTLNRKTHKAYNRIREGNFSLNRLIGFNIHHKTIGVIGTGKIGATFCRIMKGFDCNIIAYDVYPSKQLIAEGVVYKPLEEVFKTSDIISLHCPLIPETVHLINKKSLSLMKDGVMIINTSRGKLIKTVDVVKALSKEKIGYLGIDVYEQEENLFFQDLSESIIQDDVILKLNSFPNVLITSHQAYFTQEAMEEITLTTMNNITDFVNGGPLKHEVT